MHRVATGLLLFSVKVLFIGRVVFQVFAGPKVAGDVVEQVLGQHTELVKSSHCNCIVCTSMLCFKNGG